MMMQSVLSPNFVSTSSPKSPLILTIIVLLMSVAWLPLAYAQNFDEMAFGIRFEVPLFGVNTATPGVRSFVGFTPKSILSQPVSDSSHLAPLPMLGVQLTGRGSIRDAWVSNIARKKKIFIAVATTAIGVGTYLATSNDSGTNKTITTASIVSLAAIGFIATDD